MSHRLPWSALPTVVRRVIADRLGSDVVRTTSAAGGFSPAMACVADLADGRRVFIKAASTAQDPYTPDMMRGEAVINRGLSADTAPAPRLLDTYDDGTWVVLIFEEITGRMPVIPWRPDELARVVPAVAGIAALTVSSALPPAAEVFGDMFTGWASLRDAAASDPALG